MRLGTTSIATNKLTKRLVAGFAALATAATIGAAGVVGATPADKPSKDQCKAAGFSNYGQCVKDWAKQRGYGNGNNTNINTEVNVINDGDNNTVQVFINYVFG